MENSRRPFDPKIRKVGFFAPSPPPNRTQSGPPGSSPPLSNSLSPVMIPPPRHASDNLSRAAIGIGITVPGGQSNHHNHHHQGVGDGGAAADVVEVGSYNGGGESVLGGMAFSEDSGDWGVRDGDGDGMKKVLAMSLPSDGVRFHHHDDDEKVGAPVAKMPSQSKSKPLKEKTSKAERRAMQEAQRAAKAATKESSEKNIPVAASGGAASVQTGKIVKQPRQKKDGPPVTSTTAASEKKGGDRAPEKERKKDLPPPRLQFDDKSRVDKAKKRSVVKQTEVRNRVELFRHLPQYERGAQLPDLETKFFQFEPMHPAVYKVGLQYLAGDIVGENARCIAMLQAFQRAFEDYSTPSEKSINRDLIAKINSYVSFLIECRPLSISMGNAIRFLKARVTKLPLDSPEFEAKASVCSDINRFISEKIVFADRIIVKHAVTKIRDDDVLLTYGSSSTVEMIILNAQGLGKRFRVVVVDSRPKLEGQALVRRLVQNGVSCTYTHINAVSYIMHEVTRVFLGAASVLSNGTIYSRVGTACVAMVAHAFRVPVLVCCEAYKFHERVQLDSICCNELGDPDAISKVPGKEDVSHLENLANRDDMQHLNLMYDTTPSDYISAIITEYGMIPPTSVPVIIREYGGDYLFA